MAHALVPILLPLLLAGVPAGGSSDVVRGELGRALDGHLGRLARLGFSGAALVVCDGETVLAKGYGLADRAAGAPNGPATVFPLGSITKHFTAAAVVRLAGEGVLSLDDSIGRFLDDVPDDKRGITLHHLLTHGSGLPEAIGGASEAGDAATFARRVLAAELLFEPGAAVAYSNLGYGLLAAVVEEAAGVPWDEALDEAVLGPAGMERTGYARTAWGPHGLAHGYVDGVDTGTLLDAHGGRIPWGLRGAGGLQTTPEDMGRWHAALRARSVLDETAFERMTTRHAEVGPGFAMGYGCGITDSSLGPRIGHSGSNDVFSAHFHHYLERDLFVFVAANDADFYASGALEALGAILAGEEPPDVPVVVELPADELARYAGTWRLGDDGGERVEVEARGNALVLSAPTPRAASLLHPVAPRQLDRRTELLRAVEEAFPAALAGNYRPLHRLLDPYAPLEDFVRRQGRFLDGLVRDLGPLVAVRAVPGRNRFGEIAVIGVLELEAGTAMVEYSFGEREVGSIRRLDAFPERVVRPESGTSFVAYDAEADASWRVRFELDAGGRPEALVLGDERGAAHRLQR